MVYLVHHADAVAHEVDTQRPLSAAGHAHAIAAEKIWSRSFLQDGKLVIDGFDYNLTEEARTAVALSLPPSPCPPARPPAAAAAPASAPLPSPTVPLSNKRRHSGPTADG